jgi:hypothetical protein
MGIFRKLARCRKGSVTIEAVASTVLLMLVFLGTAYFGLMATAVEREQHVLRSGLDMTWQIDEETSGSPMGADATALSASLADTAGIDNPADYLFVSSIFHGDSAGIATLRWQMTAGGLANGTRASLSGGSVLYDGATYDLRDDERLVVFEFYKRGRGMSTTGVHYAGGVIYKEDPVLGP